MGDLFMYGIWVEPRIKIHGAIDEVMLTETLKRYEDELIKKIFVRLRCREFA